MKIQKLPNPICDAKQRIGYLRSFLGTVGADVSTDSYSGWCNHIRSDLKAITDEAVRIRAESLFDRILSAIYFPDKDKVQDLLRANIRDLIVYLEKHDC